MADPKPEPEPTARNKRRKRANSDRRMLPGQGRSRPRGTRGTELIDCYAHKGASCGLCGGTGKVEVAK